VGRSSPNSEWSARCHLSETELTRQRLGTFPREEMRSRAFGLKAPGQKRKDRRSVISGYFECLQIK
jgi:hypothetical protein